MMGSRDLKGLKFINHELVMQSISTENQKELGRQINPIHWKDMIVNR